MLQKGIHFIAMQVSGHNHSKGQKFDKLELLAVGYERLKAEDLGIVTAGIKTLYLFGYEDSALILGIWNAMSKKGLETISINFLNRSECYDHDYIVEGVFEYYKSQYNRMTT